MGAQLQKISSRDQKQGAPIKPNLIKKMQLLKNPSKSFLVARMPQSMVRIYAQYPYLRGAKISGPNLHAKRFSRRNLRV